MARVLRPLEAGRRFYGELVRGRTRVRVVTEAREAGQSTPRFVLAPYRSGTTLLRYCLDSHPDAAVPPETDFLIPLSSVLDDDPSMVGLADLGYDHNDVGASVGNFARRFLDTYASGRGVGNWIDKSPRYAEQPRVLMALFPDALFTVMHRHPLDQVHSFTRGGTFQHPALTQREDRTEVRPGLELITAAATYWRRVTTDLQDFANQHPDRTLRIGYESLCRNPRQVLGDVLSHFALDWSEQVLEYHRYEHDLGREAGRVAGTRGFSLSSGGWTAWPHDWVDATWEIVQDVAGSLGYSATPVSD